jgi:hypothetical protein
MAAETGITRGVAAGSTTSGAADVYTEGIRAGLLGAATIAVWFLILDSIEGRPLYTPNLLGTVLFHGSEGLPAPPAALPLSSETVVSFTWIHVLAFLLIGVGAARLLAVAERHPNAGFGIVLLFVVVQCGFFVACMLFAEPVLHALAWPAVLVGNLLAAAVMVASFRRAHPRLTISP